MSWCSRTWYWYKPWPLLHLDGYTCPQQNCSVRSLHSIAQHMPIPVSCKPSAQFCTGARGCLYERSDNDRLRDPASAIPRIHDNAITTEYTSSETEPCLDSRHKYLDVSSMTYVMAWIRPVQKELRAATQIMQMTLWTLSQQHKARSWMDICPLISLQLEWWAPLPLLCQHMWSDNDFTNHGCSRALTCIMRNHHREALMEILTLMSEICSPLEQGSCIYL